VQSNALLSRPDKLSSLSKAPVEIKALMSPQPSTLSPQTNIDGVVQRGMAMKERGEYFHEAGCASGSERLGTP